MKWWRIVAAVLLVGLAVFSATRSVSTTFNVNVQTELLELRTESLATSPWTLDSARIRIGDGVVSRFSGEIRLQEHANIEVQRVAYGPLQILILPMQRGDTDRSQEVVASLVDDEGRATRARGLLQVQVDRIPQRANEGASVVLPLTGMRLATARPVGFEADRRLPVLRAGRLAMLGRSLVQDDVFEAGTVELQMGDQVLFDSLSASGFGFAVADERPGLQVAYRVIGNEARIVRPGGEQHRVTTSLGARMLRDSGLKLIWGIVIAIIALPKAFSWLAPKAKPAQDKPADGD